MLRTEEDEERKANNQTNTEEVYAATTHQRVSSLPGGEALSRHQNDKHMMAMKVVNEDLESSTTVKKPRGQTVHIEGKKAHIGSLQSGRMRHLQQNSKFITSNELQNIGTTANKD